MNKLFTFILNIFVLIVLVFLAWCTFAQAKEFPQTFSDTEQAAKQPDPMQVDLKLDFQYSNMQAKTNNKNLYCGLSGRFKKSKAAPIELIFKNELTYSKIDDEVDTDRQLLSYQINYTLPEYYVFFNTQSLRDSAMGLESELSHGLGIGGRKGYFQAQIGIYSTSLADSVLSRAEIKGKIPISDQVNLTLVDTGELNLSDTEKYRINSEMAIEFSLTNSLGLKMGYNIIYIEDGNPDTLDTTKRSFTGLSYTF